MAGAQLGMVVAAAALALAIHLGAMALCARAMGICVRSVSYGVGPTLLRLGRLQVQPLPLSGYVTLKDSREELLGPGELGDAFNHQPVWKQVLVPLAGPAALVAAGIAILGAEGGASFIRAFAQVILGAVSPFGQAQEYLHSFQAFVGQHGFVAVLGLLCAKMAAFNLLPLPTLNGGQALVNLVKWGRPEAGWEQALGPWSSVAILLLMGAWLLAAGYFVVLR